MERDRDLLEIFDAVLPRLDVYPPRSVPAAGHREYEAHQSRVTDRRTELGFFGLMTAVVGGATWVVWAPWTPIWLLFPFVALTAACGLKTAQSFLQLAFGQRLEQALPAGTDVRTAQLEDGTWGLIRHWNADAFVWNQRVTALRLEVSGWQLLRNVPEARDIEWTEAGSAIQAEGLIAAIQGLAADRSALVARKEEIDHRLLSLESRLRQLKASEETPTLALPAPADDDSTDDG